MWQCPTCTAYHTNVGVCPRAQQVDDADMATVRRYDALRELLTKRRPDPLLVADWQWDGQRWVHASGPLGPGGARAWERWSPHEPS